jgi:hypothetical protein
MPPGDPHGWNDLDNYLNVHDAWLRQFHGYFLLENRLTLDVLGPATLVIRGRLHFVGDLFIDVDKTLEINALNQVRTVRYSYHAGIAGRADRPIFRYDNAHPHPGHIDEHHKHLFDLQTWREIKPPVCVTRAGWPTLGQVIEELFEWWEETGQFLSRDTETSS